MEIPNYFIFAGFGLVILWFICVFWAIIHFFTCWFSREFRIGIAEKIVWAIVIIGLVPITYWKEHNDNINLSHEYKVKNEKKAKVKSSKELPSNMKDSPLLKD